MPEEEKEDTVLHRKFIKENNFFKCVFVRKKMTEGKPFMRLSKKILKKAVVKNRVKRWIKEILKKHNALKNFDVFIYIKKEAPLNFKEFEKIFGELLP
ncbi:MAG: ribonuclease P protein component [Elusimicrobia bacterium]|nr:ribonuclease P protein component [Elusimicrobiota bacterium]